ncbi:peptidylprolyl isomerase [uncultured Endozoicomonas sp.]|uniref:peptidylprolyl isomerase n=1 Tax=uncultured Endozoicomonas sp. TaxID=432652 RepID=UPI00262324EF|nr:peptidylprolyl isomerase [uncultured Endozoicomonas sp.]
MNVFGKWLLASLFIMVSGYTLATEQGGKPASVVDAVSQVVLQTNKGNIVLDLAEAEAPVSVSNFINYVDNGFYDGLIFHRVINGFMVQGGGFTPDMTQKETEKPIKNESMQRGRLENHRGTVAMARTQIVDSATSQFFINLKDNHFLDGQSRKPGYTVFGRVVEGMDIVDQIARVKTGNRGPYGDVPVEPVVIEKAYLLLDESDNGDSEVKES